MASPSKTKDLTEAKQEAILRRDHHGNLMIKTNCSACKTCWAYLTHDEQAGKCIYGGPYSGYEVVEDNKQAKPAQQEKQVEASKEAEVS